MSEMVKKTARAGANFEKAEIGKIPWISKCIDSELGDGSFQIWRSTMSKLISIPAELEREDRSDLSGKGFRFDNTEKTKLSIGMLIGKIYREHFFLSFKWADPDEAGCGQMVQKSEGILPLPRFY